MIDHNVTGVLRKLQRSNRNKKQVFRIAMVCFSSLLKMQPVLVWIHFCCKNSRFESLKRLEKLIKVKTNFEDFTKLLLTWVRLTSYLFSLQAYEININFAINVCHSEKYLSINSICNV